MLSQYSRTVHSYRPVHTRRMSMASSAGTICPWGRLSVSSAKTSFKAAASRVSFDGSTQVGRMAFAVYLGCASMDLVDYPQSTCLSAGAATPLNLGADSWRRFFEAFAQLIAGTPSLRYIWPCLGACYANIVLTLSDSTRPPGDAVPACLTVQAGQDLRAEPLCTNFEKFL